MSFHSLENEEKLSGSESTGKVTNDVDENKLEEDINDSDLSAAESDLSAAESDLSAPESDLCAPESDLSAAESDLCAPESDLCATDLDFCATDLDEFPVFETDALEETCLRKLDGIEHYILGMKALIATRRECALMHLKAAAQMDNADAAFVLALVENDSAALEQADDLSYPAAMVIKAMLLREECETREANQKLFAAACAPELRRLTPINLDFLENWCLVDEESEENSEDDAPPASDENKLLSALDDRDTDYDAIERNFTAGMKAIENGTSNKKIYELLIECCGSQIVSTARIGDIFEKCGKSRESAAARLSDPKFFKNVARGLWISKRYASLINEYKNESRGDDILIGPKNTASYVEKMPYEKNDDWAKLRLVS